MNKNKRQLNHSRYRPSVESLEARRLLSVTVNEFPLPSGTVGLAAAPDGSLWFPLGNQEIGRMTVAGSLSRIDVGADLTGGVSVSPNGDVWFTASGSRIGRRTTSGDLTFFDVPSGPNDTDPRITADRDGNIWFTEETANKIGRLTPAGTVTEFVIPTANANPIAICASPDGSIWFTEFNVRAVGRIDTSGKIDEFATPTRSTANPGGKSYFSGIAAGPDGNVWFTEEEGFIGRITSQGQIAEFALHLPPSGGQPYAICAGPDGNIWFTDLSATALGRVTPNGQVTAFPIPTGMSFPAGIAAAADGNIWFGEEFAPHLGRVSIAYTDLGVSIECSSDSGNCRSTFDVHRHGHESRPDRGDERDRHRSNPDRRVPGGLDHVEPGHGAAIAPTGRHEPDQFGNRENRHAGARCCGRRERTALITPPMTQAIANHAVVQADESDHATSNDSADLVTSIVIAAGHGSERRHFHGHAPVYRSNG